MLHKSRVSWLTSVCLVVGGLGIVGVAGTARGEVIFSNYGPGMTYNTDTTNSPSYGGAFLAYNMQWYEPTGSRNMMVYASFTTPTGADWFATSVTMAVRTYMDVQLFIVEDVDGRPKAGDRGGYLYDDLQYGSSNPALNPVNDSLLGRFSYDGNVTIAMDPGNVLDEEFRYFKTPRPMSGGTKYWLLLQLEYPTVRYLDINDDRAYTRWYRSLNDPAAPSGATFVRDLPSASPDSVFFDGPRPVFEIEATAVPIPEPTSATVVLPAVTAVALLRRRRARA